MSSHGTMVTTSQTRPYQGFPYTNPSVQDVPTINPSANDQWANLPRKQITTTPKIVINPPGNSRQSEPQDPTTPDFVRETILYDPFENNKISINGRPQDERRPNTNNPTSSYSSSASSISSEDAPRIYVPQMPLDSIEDYAGPSSSTASNTRPAPSVPSFMNKEASIYQQSNSDGFNLTPIPVSEFPEPPPAYSEIDRAPRSPAPPVPTPAVITPPRTQVIVPMRVADPPGNTVEGRKYLECPHCAKQVHTMVIRESGVATHVAAWAFCIFFLIPITILIYCTDYCKYKNHYCPECNKLVGYEIPMTCQGFVYTERSN